MSPVVVVVGDTSKNKLSSLLNCRLLMELLLVLVFVQVEVEIQVELVERK